MAEKSRLLFVGGPLHGRCHTVPDGMSTYAVWDPAEMDWSAFWRDEPAPTAPPILYQRIGWPYVVEEEFAGSDVDHRYVMLGPITEDRPTTQAQDGQHLVYGYIADRMWMARAEDLIPPCVVPSCGEKGRAVVYAAEWGRFVGRWWDRGEKIRLCPAHMHDVYSAQHQYGGVESLPEWLRPDACNLDPLDAMTYYNAPDEGYAHRGRVIRVGTNVPGLVRRG